MNSRVLVWVLLWVSGWAALFVEPSWAGTIVPEPEVSGYVHEVFGVDDGLPRAGVSQLMQTADGYLWLATLDGLVRFDGARTEVFASERTPALGSNRIVNLLETRDGTLWILSEQGHLSRWREGRFTACGEARADRVDCGLPRGPDHYSKFFEDPQGTLWVGSETALYRWDDEALWREASIVNPGRINAFLADRSGNLWVAAGRGLWKGRGGSFKPVALPGDAPVWQLAMDGQGTVWVPRGDVTGRIVDGRFQQEFDQLSGVYADSRGQVWLSTFDGLLRWQGDRFRTHLRGPDRLSPVQIPRQPSPAPTGWFAWGDRLLREGVPVLSANTTWTDSLWFDHEGSLWLATAQAGDLHALHPSRVTTVVAEGNFYSAYQGDDGTLWFGGVDIIASRGSGAETFRKRAPPNHGLVWAFLQDAGGTFWVAAGWGLFTLEEDRFTGPHLQLGPGDQILALHQDGDGTLWLGSTAGLFRRESAAVRAAWKPVALPAGTGELSVRVILEGGDGVLWLGTDGRGLLRYQPATGELRVIDRSRGLASDLVRCLWRAPDEQLWIGTENRGLVRLDPGTLDRNSRPELATLGRDQGLPTSGIHHILDDGLGNLWMSSNDGIFRARLADLEAAADGELSRVPTVLYTERDGMRNREANGGAQQAGVRDRQGNLWFPTQAGAVQLEPRRLLAPIPPPPVHVEALRVGEESLPLPRAASDEPLRLDPEQRSFRIAYTAPFFRDPDQLRFRYRLRPYDEEWIEADGLREAFYTKVPPGRYTFEVAVEHEGTWSPQLASIDLRVAPRFHETGAFLGLCGLGVVFLLAAVVILRDRRAEARRKKLEEIVRERTAIIRQQARQLQHLDRLRAQLFANVSHEFRTPLTLILGPMRDALGGSFGPLSDSLAPQIALAEQNAERLLALVDQLLQIARLDAGRFELKLHRGDLVEHLRQRVENFAPLAERQAVDLKMRLPKGALPWTFDPQELAKVFDNLLSNALKFTPRGSTVRVSLTAPGPEAHITVEDEGPGIPTDQRERIFDRFQQGTGRDPKPGFGLGLALARQLTELHGGTLAVADSLGPGKKGACFVVTLPETFVDEAGGVVEATPSAPSAPSVRLPGPEAVAPAAAHRSPGADSTERATLLVVDDNADIRAYLRRHLETRHEIVEAADGIEALREARRLQPDLIVSDIMMPGLDGQDLARTLRRDSRLMLVPVILVTAKASEESRLVALREGVDDYLIKPFDPRELLARVDNLLTVRRRLLEHIRPPKAPLQVSEVEVTPADEAFLARVSRLVEAHLDDPELTVAGLSEKMGCDRSYLLRKLRTLTGETPSDLIRSFRLQRAEQLLRARAGAITDVAYAVGFKTVPHFSNAFLDRFGERPSVFVENILVRGSS